LVEGWNRRRCKGTLSRTKKFRHPGVLSPAHYSLRLAHLPCLMNGNAAAHSSRSTLPMPQPQRGPRMVELERPRFDVAGFLGSAGLGRRIIQLTPKSAFFSQGDPADSVFYLRKGRAKVTVVSPAGKEATIALLSAGDFVGEEALAAAAGLRLATATAITACTALRISRDEMDPCDACGA